MIKKNAGGVHMGDNTPRYKRVLIKISGEALAGDKHFGLDFDIIKNVCSVIKNPIRVSSRQIVSNPGCIRGSPPVMHSHAVPASFASCAILTHSFAVSSVPCRSISFSGKCT